MTDSKNKIVKNTKNYNSTQINFIDWYSFCPSKLNFVLKSIKNSIICLSIYKYNNEINSSFCFCTSFIKLVNSPVIDNTKNKIKIMIDPNDMIFFFKQLDTMIKEFMDKSEYKDYKQRQLLKLKYRSFDKYEYIKIILRNETEIINYNISKKYPISEYCSISDVVALKRVFKPDKEIKLLLKPIIWLSVNSKTYGIKLIAEMIEVKFPNNTIQSKFDTEYIQHSVESVVI